MVYLKVKEILNQKKKTKYWFIKKMEGNYQSLSNLLNNETTLECEPGDIIVRKGD